MNLWILFGTTYDTVENEPCVYFIGAFDTLEKADEARETLVIGIKNKSDYFIKKAAINHTYDHSWSNNDDV